LRVLVIGGTAFVGPHVVRRLCTAGHEVAVFHRGRTECELPAAVRHMHCDAPSLADRGCFAEFAGAFREFAPEVVLDMIPVTEAVARAAVEAFRGIARRLVAVSSQDVYRAYGILLGQDPGPPVPVPMSEDAPLRSRLYPYRADPPRPAEDPRRWMDDYDKITVERVVMGEPDLPGTVLRFPMVYGPGDRQHRLYEYLRRMLDRRPAVVLEAGLAAWRWTRGYVENVAAAAYLAVTDERAAGFVFNVGEPDALSTAEWVTAIGTAAGWSGEIVPVPKDELPESLQHGMNTAQDLVANTARIRAELGYTEGVDRAEALARTVAWERENPPTGAAVQPVDYREEDRILARIDRDR
jgi:nucleoside-diphosphate-sugar epimerase